MNPPSGVLTAADVLDGPVDGLLGHVDARVARGAEGHQLADGDGDVGVESLGIVAPAAFFVLGVDDQFDSAAEGVAEFHAERHSVALGQEHGGETVSVHRTVACAAWGIDEAAFLGIGQQVVDGLVEGSAMGAATGRAACRHEGHAGQPGHCGVAFVGAGAERAVVVLA